MDWIRLTIRTTRDGSEPLCAVLADFGADGFEIQDSAEFKRFLEQNKARWDYIDEGLFKDDSGQVLVSLYLSDNPAGHAKKELIRECLKELKTRDKDNMFGSLDLSYSRVNEEDWAENWKKFFHPVKIGKRVLIRPEWESCDNPEGRVVLLIDPGMSFGTGTHETTKLCIEALDEHIKDGAAVLDIGCGSGILSVAALLLGAASAVGVDIDSNAVETAYKNAKLNGLSKERFGAHTGDILTDEALRLKLSNKKYDVVIANIVADVIIPLCGLVPGFLNKDGIFISSGIIASKEDPVRQALEKQFDIIKSVKDNDWVAFHAKRKTR